MNAMSSRFRGRSYVRGTLALQRRPAIASCFLHHVVAVSGELDEVTQEGRGAGVQLMRVASANDALATRS